ncbi:flagellar basal body-associated protein FliL [Vibrio azureus]|uniref:Flagellar protein FliL n=1 Tax=Vibrio azureus NBRC 104587 TaxID=1219077 RepID=U3ACE9_9VIBR|nr:flagellar basal body-associated protein FliL [Vibrio azureus]AUI87266.1 flagellar basal body-associated protein FliL [Vibrio azureus]GAD77616.1 flagellar biosynthesis protein FliL [Vibrio azureus NBRC 104587]
MYKRYISTLIFALSLFASNLSLAEDKPAESQLAYFTLEPDLTTNFHTNGKKLGYIKVRIDIMVMNPQDLAIVEHHQPLIRDAVIELLGKQSEDTIKSLSGREDLRKTLVHKINEILLPETGKTVIADLLFTKYLYQ